MRDINRQKQEYARRQSRYNKVNFVVENQLKCMFSRLWKLVGLQTVWMKHSILTSILHNLNSYHERRLLKKCDGNTTQWWTWPVPHLRWRVRHRALRRSFQQSLMIVSIRSLRKKVNKRLISQLRTESDLQIYNGLENLSKHLFHFSAFSFSNKLLVFIWRHQFRINPNM